MFTTKFIGALIIAATAVASSSAMADDRGVNTVAGAVSGAAIGPSPHSRPGALGEGGTGAAAVEVGGPVLGREINPDVVATRRR